MSTEERIAALEQSLAASQRDAFDQLREHNRQMAAINRALAEQELHSRDADHNLTILVTVSGRQGNDLKAIQQDLGAIKERVGDMDQRMESQFETLGKRLDGVDRRLEGIERQMEQRLTSLETKFDQMLQQLATLIAKPEAGTEPT